MHNQPCNSIKENIFAESCMSISHKQTACIQINIHCYWLKNRKAGCCNESSVFTRVAIISRLQRPISWDWKLSREGAEGGGWRGGEEGRVVNVYSACAHHIRLWALTWCACMAADNLDWRAGGRVDLAGWGCGRTGRCVGWAASNGCLCPVRLTGTTAAQLVLYN